MKNFKYTKTFASLVLAGVIFTGCSDACDLDKEHYHIFMKDDKAFYFQEEEKEGYDKKEYVVFDNFLVENNLFPLEAVIGDVNDFVNSLDKYVEAANIETYHDKDGKLQFNTYWRLLSNEELKNYSGIVREGASVKYVVYKLGEKNNLERLEVDNLNDLEGKYYIDFAQITSIVDPVQTTYHDGKVYVKK